MDVMCRVVGSIAVLDCTGRLVVSAGETEVLSLRSAVQRLIAEGHLFLALNVARLTYIDARGLGELVWTATRLRRCGGELLLVSPTTRLTKLLSVTRLAAVIDACDCESDAILRLSRPVGNDCERALSGV
jgi:anti-anti-sigma factor